MLPPGKASVRVTSDGFAGLLKVHSRTCNRSNTQTVPGDSWAPDAVSLRVLDCLPGSGSPFGVVRLFRIAQ